MSSYGLKLRQAAGDFAEAVLFAQNGNDGLNRDARYNLWEGQTADGRKWVPRTNDREVLPWKGASDCKVPMVDTYAAEDVAKLVVGLMLAQLAASPAEAVHDASWGNRVTQILRWLTTNQMPELFEEASLLANYLKENGKAALGVFWKRETQLGYDQITGAMIEQVQQQAIATLSSVGTAPDSAAGAAPSAAAPGAGAQPQAGAGMTEEQYARLVQASQLVEIFRDKTREEEAVALLQEHARELVKANFSEMLGEYEDELLADYELSKQAARRMVRELRDTKDGSLGSADMTIPTVVCNRPTLVALRPGEDFFMPKDCGDPRRARRQWMVEWLSEEELKERKVSNTWDSGWVDEVIAKCRGATFKTHGLGGRWTETVGEITMTMSQARGFSGTSGDETGVDDRNMEQCYFVVHQWERRCDESGVPGIYYTVFHPNVMGVEDGAPERGSVERGTGAASGSMDDGFSNRSGESDQAAQGSYGVDELMTYDHGEYPITYFRTEYLSRKATDSRGYGELGFTWQNTVKTELDMEIDRSTLSTNPPLHHPRGRPPSKWCPGAKIGAARGEYHYAEIPKYDPSARDLGARMWHMADRRFGRQAYLPDGTPCDAVGPQVLQKYWVMGWLNGWKQAFTQVFQLCQQFMPTEFYYRVIGTQNSAPIKASREEIQGKFNLTIGFDERRLAPEQLQMMLDWIIKLRQTVDTSARIDPDELVVMALEWLDPNLPERLIRPKQQADEAEVDDTKNVVARMAAGMDEDVKLSGQNYGLRVGVVNDLIFGMNPQKPNEPKNPELFQRFQQDPGFQQRVGKYLQQLHFQMNERTVNAQQGRLGG